jgi:UDP-glucose 6-dehydrogenase
VKWFDHKYGKDKDVRTWIKAHLACGVKTNIVTAVELTMTNEHDSKFLPELVTQTAQNFNVKEVGRQGVFFKSQFRIDKRVRGCAVYSI